MTTNLPTRRTAGRGLQNLKDANSALLRSDVEAGRLVYRGLPEVVTLNHSDICNLRCIMCPRHDAQGVNRLDEDTLRHITNELLPTARKLVLTTAGAEPLAVDYELLMEQARRHEVRVDAVTNGVLLTADVYRRSRETLDHLNVSLDSHVREVYERIRIGASYERVIGNLEAVCEERRGRTDDVLFSLSAIVMASNVPHLAAFVRFAASLGSVDGVVFQRLRHEEKPAPQEEPYDAFSEAEILAAFEDARREAEAGGINLFLSEFGLPPTLARPIRTKIPETLEGRGLCWFLAQNFTVMYTGEVFPCCIPTDYSLGNVLYQDPVDIWNGKRMQKLRAAHLSRRGTTFCTGCLHAPHLPSGKETALQKTVKKARVSLSESLIKGRKRFRGRFSRRIFASDHPPMIDRTEPMRDESERARVTDAPAVGTVSRVDPRDGSILSLESGALVRRPTLEAPPESLVQFDGDPTASCLGFVEGAVLFGFEDGVLRRFDGTRAATVLELSDPRSFVRSSGLAVTPRGDVVVGEYGVFPGARCAHLYESRDRGRSFRHLEHLRSARHVHVVQPLADGRVAVTTGDIADERRLHALRRGGRAKLMRRGWSGYTAIAEASDAVHCGTDMPASNGIAAFRRGLDKPPEYRRLPEEHDVQVREMLSLGSGRLLALCSADETPELRAGRRAALICSRDGGQSFAIVHRFAEDWHDAPETLLLLGLDPIQVLMPAVGCAKLLELDLS